MGRFIRVLLIEDSEDDAFLIVRELKKAGFHFEHQRVSSERALRDALSDRQWDIVISDFAMPQFDGLAAAEIVRAQGLDVPFIFVSGVIGEERALQAMRAGVRDYLTKDNLARLSVAVQREVDNTRTQRTAQRQVAQARRYAEDMVASVRLPMVIVDAQLFVVSANPAFEEAFLSHDRVNEGTLVDCPGLGSDRAQLRKDLLQALEQSEALQAREVDLELKGQTRNFLLSAQRIMLAGREGPRLLVSLQDVTDNKLMQRKMNAAQRMEAVGLLAGGVAHDFNNILTIIDNYASFLAEHVQDDAQGQGDLQMIQDASARATRLTQQLLAFSRKQTQDLRAVSINEVVEGVTNLLARVLGEHIQLETSLGGEVATINADVAQLEQVIMNLVVNARDAMPTGGRLRIETSQVELDDAYGLSKGVELQQRQFALLCVSDTGVGMDRTTLSRVFEPFFTTKDADRGTGLGLATVYGIVKQCHGYIWLYSEPGLGTAVKVYLPIPDQLAPRTESPPPPHLNSSPNQGSILIVEDDEGVRRAASRILRTAGYTVFEAPDGVEGLEQVKQISQLDLVLTDVVMPHMTGVRLGKQLRVRKPQTPVVYMSGYTDAMINEMEPLPERVPYYLQKPFSRRSLLEAISDALLARTPTAPRRWLKVRRGRADDRYGPS